MKIEEVKRHAERDAEMTRRLIGVYQRTASAHDVPLTAIGMALQEDAALYWETMLWVEMQRSMRSLVRRGVWSTMLS